MPEFYNEDKLFETIGIDRIDFFDLPRRQRATVNTSYLAAIREARIREVDGDEEEGGGQNNTSEHVQGKGKHLHPRRASDVNDESAFRRATDSGLGVRFQGGRIYDSKYGLTCHWCRQKTLEEHVTCTNELCGGGKRLPVSLCRMCLKNRHGEDIQRAIASNCWVCPACRGSCGAGCRCCCNCGPCRKKAGLGPTHQLIKEARAAHFTNVHDYLIHMATGEDQESIAARKFSHDWGAWLALPYSPKTEKESGGVAAAAAVVDAAVHVSRKDDGDMSDASTITVSKEDDGIADGEEITSGVRGFFSACKKNEQGMAVYTKPVTRKQKLQRTLGLGGIVNNCR